MKRSTIEGPVDGHLFSVSEEGLSERQLLLQQHASHLFSGARWTRPERKASDLDMRVES